MDARRNASSPLDRSAVTRRAALRGLGVAGLAATIGAAAARPARAASGMETAPIEPNAGTWKTWLLTSGNQLRPAAPPDAAASAQELALLRRFENARGKGERADVLNHAGNADLDAISYWNAGAPGFRWNEIALKETMNAGMTVDAYRVMALLNIVIYDATIAVWDAKYAYNRPRPAAADASVGASIPTPSSPSYPSDYAATAMAASTLLSYLFPKSAEMLSAKAADAMRSRVAAGVEYQSDAEAGAALGKKVGEMAVAWAKTDNSNAVFDKSAMPKGPGIWTGEPLLPMYGAWKTWVLTSPSQFRPAAPPAYDSAQRAAELAEVKNYKRDAGPGSEVQFWPEDPAGRPKPDSVTFSSNQLVFYWAPLLHYIAAPELARKISEYGWNLNPPRAARAFALTAVAAYDSTVACWEAKYHYWTARPNQFDPTLTTVIPTYPMPDYPSGHATGAAAIEAIMAYLFPREAACFNSRAEECAMSRVWAGIHFRSAVESGLKLGRDVAQAVIDRAATDGAD